MIYTHVATAVLAAALSFGAAWQIQNWRMDANEKHRVEEQLADERELASMERKRINNVLDAQNNARLRERGLRADAGAARATVDGLRSAAERTVQAARSSLDACTERAAALGELLASVADAGADLAEKAGRHVNDIQTLTEAYPR